MIDASMLHDNPLLRERLFRDYVRRNLGEATSEMLESHYLGCDSCFAELTTAHLIISGFQQGSVYRRDLNDVVVIEFSGPAHLVRQSDTARQLEGILHDGDSRVLIDLSQVTRIDSAGLGVLMSCYSHLLRKRGMLKVLRPSDAVREVFQVTKLDGLFQTFDDESQALRSFVKG